MSTIDKSDNGIEPAPRRVSPFKVLLLIAAAVLGLQYIIGPMRHSRSDSAVAWRSDFAQAAEQARAGGKVVFAEFAASWCPPCRQMERTVFADKLFAAALEQAAVPLRVDMDQPEAQQLATRHKVEAIPTYIVFAPDGTALARSGGVRSREDLLDLVRRASQKAATAARE